MTQAHDYTMTIGGKAVAGAASFAVLNPANEQVIGHAPDASPAQLDAAVAAARAAFPAWSATPIDQRRQALLGIAGVLAGNVEELKRLLTSEQGKPHADAMGDILGGAFWCQATSTLELPVTVTEDTAERRGETRHVPIGVVGAIAPWNFPIILAMFKVAPALLAGNTVVLKPSPFTPLTTLRLGELLRGVLPDGVLNIVTGGDDLGPWMTSHPGIDKVSFTGSTQTGRKVMASAASTLKRVTLELGGNDAAIVMPDVDVAQVAEQLFWAAFRNTGQICIATKRMYVHKDIYEPLKDAIVAYAATVKMGDGAEQGTQLGPIQNKLQYQRVLDLIEDAKAKGYKFLIGGEKSEAPGYFVPVTIIDNPPENSRIVQEEQFGPVLPLLKFDDLDEVIGKANATEYGLGGSVWSADEDRALEIAARLATGTVWINESQHLSPLAAFGGHKQSGVGVEGALEGLLEYTNAQTIFVKKKAA
ncbi:MAG: aldehyde dehydrogenase family protein [Caulobacter sp.]|nr:aldehyde dehydrogenase family protein [Caulobacter sp.]